jgi:hypothetical protein
MSLQTGREKAWAELAGIPMQGYNQTFRIFATGQGWQGTMMDQMRQYLQSITGSSSTNIPDLQRTVANLLGVVTWNMVGYDIITLSGPVVPYFVLTEAGDRIILEVDIGFVLIEA